MKEKVIGKLELISILHRLEVVNRVDDDGYVGNGALLRGFDNLEHARKIAEFYSMYLLVGTRVDQGYQVNTFGLRDYNDLQDYEILISE